MSDPEILIEFNSDDWEIYLEYANLKTRGGFNIKNDSMIFLNNQDISDQDYDNFNPTKYKHMIIEGRNTIRLLILNDYIYTSHIWIYPRDWDDETTKQFLNSEFEKWS